jgi:hypothetical protein
MEFHNSFHGTDDPAKMLVAYSVSLKRHEAVILKPIQSMLTVDASKIQTPLDLFSSDGAKLPEGSPLGLTFSLVGAPNSTDAAQPKFELGSVFKYTTFKVADLRKAYVFVREIENAVINSFILKAPMTPIKGFQRTWSVDVDLPRGFLNAEAGLRQVHLHF